MWIAWRFNTPFLDCFDMFYKIGFDLRSLSKKMLKEILDYVMQEFPTKTP